MKTKLLWSIWLLAISVITTGFINYNIETYEEDVNVKCVSKYRPFREHKGHTYYGGDYNMIISHVKYGHADIRVNVDTYENHKPGDIMIFGWSQSDLEKHFRNYPERIWYLQFDLLVIWSFVLIVICFIITIIISIRSDQ